MKSIFTIAVLFVSGFFAGAQSLYVKSFGNPKDQTILFLHGGPGYNCAGFEATTAQNLADNGFFVIVYDRRGEGRSKDVKAKFTFQQTFDDIDDIYRQYQIKKATLIGHSFGGIVATRYTAAHPDKVQSLVLVGAPVSLQRSFRNIIAKSKAIYLSKNDSLNLGYISMLENMDTASIEYAVYCFGHAMQNKFYSPQKPSEEAQKIYATFKTDTILKKYASQMTREATQGFWANEKYTTLDLTANLKKLLASGTKVYGLYGKEDGLYAAEQIMMLQGMVGDNNLLYLDNCSHSVFVDQQTQFIKSIKMWAN
jgi:proline iminopeptidase